MGIRETNIKIMEPSMRLTCFLSLAMCLMVCSLAAVSGEDSADEAKKFKLNVTVFDQLPANKAVQSLSEAASRCYGDGNFLEAERLYAQALELAKNNNAPAEAIARLTCNLASVFRQEKKFDEAQNYFEQSVEICRSTHLNPSTCEYVAKQYAGLLRKKGQETQANIILASAKIGFHVITGPSLKATNDIVPAAFLPTPQVSRTTHLFGPATSAPADQRVGAGVHKIVAFGFGLINEASLLADNPHVTQMSRIPNTRGICFGYIASTLMPGPGPDCKVITEVIMPPNQTAIGLNGVSTRMENGQLVAAYESGFHGNTTTVVWVLQQPNDSTMHYHINILVGGTLDKEVDFNI